MKKLKEIVSCLFKLNIWQTLKVNFVTLPLRQALNFPIAVYGSMKFVGLRKGCIRLQNVNRRFSIKLGVEAFTPYPKSFMKFMENAVLELDHDVVMARGFCVTINKNAKLSIGSNTTLNHNAFVSCSRSIEIGKNCRTGWNCQFYDSSFHLVYDDENKCVTNPFGAIKVGDNVWLSSNVCLLKNAYIPSKSIVSSYSLVNKDFSEINTEGNFFAGIPAKLKRTGLFRFINRDLEKELIPEFSNSEQKEFAFCSEQRGDFHKYLNV